MEAAEKRRYQAMIWIRDQPGKPVSVDAESLAEAKEMLETKYGEGTVFDLRNEGDAARPR